MLELYHSPTSPYVRKVLVCAHELGVFETVRLLPGGLAADGGRAFEALNPLGKVPTARIGEGVGLYDSPVICEYLDAAAGGALFPGEGEARWTALRRQALGDGLLDAALLIRYEFNRPENLRSGDWLAKQRRKIEGALEAMETEAGALGAAVDIGTITLGCALAYLDFRFGENDWRPGRPELAQWHEEFSQRPSMQATAFKG